MFSHPGKKLEEHLENVKKLGLAIFDSKTTLWSSSADVRKALEIILYYHDAGKSTGYFQKYIQDTNNPRYKSEKERRLKAHSFLSAFITLLELRKNLSDHKLIFLGFIIVLHHHSKLKNVDDLLFQPDGESFSLQLKSFDPAYFDINENELEELQLYLDDGLDFVDQLDDELESLTIEDYFLFNYLFSILISADKGEAIFYTGNRDIETLFSSKITFTEIDEDLVDRYKSAHFGPPERPVDKAREEIYTEVEQSILSRHRQEKIFSINVPTGSGKTLTALNAALKLKSRNPGYKIIYSLPFTSIIDQNYDVFSEVLGERSKNSSVLLKHHHLAQKKYSNPDENIDFDYSISEYLIENWDSEMIVTTFVQLLHSLLSNKNRALKKFHNLANSIIILDEVQSIPYKYWELIKVALSELSRVFHSYIILVTATLPLIFNENKNEITELAVNKEEYFKKFDRIDLDLTDYRDFSLDEFNRYMADEITGHNSSSFLIILNTIKSSIAVFDALKNREGYTVVYLSTNVIPRERKKRIKLIKETEKVIVVSTQLIEAGVDIDLDRVYRDLSSFDSLNQSAGRANRNGVKSRGMVKFFKIKDNTKYFAEYIYSDLLLNKTDELLKEVTGKIPEVKMRELSNKYFSAIDSAKSGDTSHKLLDFIGKLQFKDAFEGENKFELIKNDFSSIDLFIENDENAVKLWNAYRDIVELSPFERKEEFDRIKSCFLSYVISVPEKCYPQGQEGFNRISFDEIDRYYEPETGFKRDIQLADFFF